MTVSVPYLENSAIWDLADKTRAKMWDGKIPVNVDLIAEKLFDIQFVPINDLIRCVHSEAHLAGSLDEIDYDPAANEVRLCFSVAHELGHRVLHPGQIQKLRSGSFAEWKETLLNLPEGVWGRAEYQAREFAGRLLVPRDSLINAIKSQEPQIRKAVETVENLESPALIEFLAPRISRPFAVSDIVLKTRLTNEGLDPLSLV